MFKVHFTRNWPVSVVYFPWVIISLAVSIFSKQSPILTSDPLNKWFFSTQLPPLDSFSLEWKKQVAESLPRPACLAPSMSHAKPLKSPPFPIFIVGFRYQQVASTTCARQNAAEPFPLTTKWTFYLIKSGEHENLITVINLTLHCFCNLLFLRFFM